MGVMTRPTLSLAYACAHEIPHRCSCYVVGLLSLSLSLSFVSRATIERPRSSKLYSIISMRSLLFRLLEPPPSMQLREFAREILFERIATGYANASVAGIYTRDTLCDTDRRSNTNHVFAIHPFSYRIPLPSIKKVFLCIVVV